MSRGFDGFEIDDFRNSAWERDSRSLDREASRGRGGNWATERSTTRKLENLREAERSLDVLNRLSQEHSNEIHPALPREEQQRSTLSNQRQTIYTDRDRTYSLRDSEVNTLSEVGRFRVVDAADLAQFAYSGERSRMERDVYNLVRQGLAPTVAIQSGEGLGFCEPRDAGQTTILAREPITPAHSSCREALRDNQTDWLAYVPAQLRNAFESEWRGHKGRSRIFAPCQQPDHAGHLYPSVDSGEAVGTNQSGSDDSTWADANRCSGRREVNLLIVPFCSHAGKPNFPQVHEKNGGDDGTRTRGLCRDRAAF